MARSGSTQAIEGEPPGRIVILQFPDRAATSTSRVYGVDGYDG